MDNIWIWIWITRIIQIFQIGLILQKTYHIYYMYRAEFYVFIIANWIFPWDSSYIDKLIVPIAYFF